MFIMQRVLHPVRLEVLTVVTEDYCLVRCVTVWSDAKIRLPRSHGTCVLDYTTLHPRSQLILMCVCNNLKKL